ncbi:MAG: PBP1A family penicillin-binding protein [Deltaproteobacteria bacterium]|nr:PBP1A family penicillin-binding protein [Deltaproteobacteria bacterium]
MKRVYLFFKFCFYLCMMIVLSVAGFSVYLYAQFSKDLPLLDSLRDYHPPVISEVFSDDGTKVGEFWIERRIVLSPQEIPKTVEEAIIASEDSAFFEHSGIDVMGIFRAMLENLRAGQIVQGGSTITQQVVKSFLLTSEKSWERKIKEAILAQRLEDNFSKQEILYLYLNQIFFGNRAYGIEAAAQNYFHKSAKELNIAEAAMIAGLAKAPSKFNPILNFERSKQRQEYVIDRMFEEGYISEKQKTEAKRASLEIFQAPTDKQYNMRYAPWFVEEIRRRIIEKYGEDAPYTHGLKIYTTLDLNAQKAAHDAIWKGLTELHKRHGYAGPIKKLPVSEFDNFNYTVRREMFFESLPPGTIIPDLTKERVKTTKLNLKKDKLYQGIVTEIDKKTKTVTVSVGGITGIIIPKNYGWARKRNNDASGYDGVLYITSPDKTFEVGDVIEVKVVDVAGLEPKDKKNYEENKTYFSLEQTPLAEGALFSYDANTGYVRAIIGGKDFLESEFNRATQAVRQTGSVFKALLYTGAVDKGYKPETVIQDEPIRIPDGPGRYWEPKNYGGGYRGPMSLRSALIASRNVVSVRIILDIGVEYVTALCRKLGFSTDIAKVYSMALGANDMKVMEVARAFGIFPTGGVLPDLIFVKRMTDRFGTTLEINQPKKITDFKQQIEAGTHAALSLVSETDANTENLRADLWTEAQSWVKKDHLMLTPFEEIILYGKHLPEGYIMSPKTIGTMVEIMQAIVSGGTGYRVHALGRPVAGKTGTTNDLTDCWFVGYTPDHVAGVWTGYDQATTKVGGGETGGKAAAPIFLYYMQEFLKDKPVTEFRNPKETQYAELDPPIRVAPTDISNMFTSGGLSGGGGADFFADDL